MTSGELAQAIRRDALQMVHEAGASHIGSCLSCADLLAVLYADVLQIDPHRPEWPGRDRFILSKGHAAAALYATLANRGFFPREGLAGYCRGGSPLAGHATSHGVPGVELSTGALGHGLPVGCGLALGGCRTYVLMSDGECDEGSTWEAALFAAHHHLVNLTVLIDYNKIQSYGTVDEVLSLEPFADKWRAFGWDVDEIDGHDHDAIRRACRSGSRPKCLVAHTVKGKGVSFMENELVWHYKSPDPHQLANSLAEVG